MLLEGSLNWIFKSEDLDSPETLYIDREIEILPHWWGLELFGLLPFSTLVLSLPCFTFSKRGMCWEPFKSAVSLHDLSNRAPSPHGAVLCDKEKSTWQQFYSCLQRNLGSKTRLEERKCMSHLMYRWKVMSDLIFSFPSSATSKIVSSPGLSQCFISSPYKNLSHTDFINKTRYLTQI